MNRAELAERWERRRAEAERHGATAPLARVYSVVLEELRALDGRAERGRMVGTGEAAEILAVSAKTVRRWIRNGRFPGAQKTSSNGAGEWRIPATEVHRAGGAKPEGEGVTPRLWEPDP